MRASSLTQKTTLSFQYLEKIWNQSFHILREILKLGNVPFSGDIAPGA